MQLRTHNLRLVGKLATVALGMFAFGYALVPLYKAICEVTGINVLALTERDTPGAARAGPTLDSTGASPWCQARGGTVLRLARKNEDAPGGVLVRWFANSRP